MVTRFVHAFTCVALLIAFAAPSEAVDLDAAFSGWFARLGARIAERSTTGTVDVLLVADNGDEPVRDAFSMLAASLDAEQVEYRMCVVGRLVGAMEWTTDIQQLREKMLRLGGPVREGELLDNLTTALYYAQFRETADKHIVLITDRPARSSAEAAGVSEERKAYSRDQVVRRGITVHVLGYREQFQRDLASKTGGRFFAFSSLLASERDPVGEAQTSPGTPLPSTSAVKVTSDDTRTPSVAGSSDAPERQVDGSLTSVSVTVGYGAGLPPHWIASLSRPIRPLPYVAVRGLWDGWPLSAEWVRYTSVGPSADVFSPTLRNTVDQVSLLVTPRLASAVGPTSVLSLSGGVCIASTRFSMINAFGAGRSERKTKSLSQS